MRDQIFISYSHLDKQYQQRLRKHLASFERDNLINLWTDDKARPGDTLDLEIENAINKTAIAILLVSANFTGSDYIAEKELPKFIKAWEKNNVRIMPVMVRPCSIKNQRVLSKLKFVNDLDKPISSMTENDQEEIWARLADEIFDIYKDINKKKKEKNIASYDENEDFNPEVRTIEDNKEQTQEIYWKAEHDFIDKVEKIDKKEENKATASKNAYMREFMGELFDNPSIINQYHLYQYYHIDNQYLMPKLKEVIGSFPEYEKVNKELSALFGSLGWEGKDDIRVMWFPPFLKIGEEDTWGNYAFFAKQKKNGISFIATRFEIPFLENNSNAYCLPKILYPENGYFCTYIKDKYFLKPKNHKFYLIDGLISLKTLGAKRYELEETHWIADWHSKFSELKLGDAVCFKFYASDFYPYGFVHNKKRVTNIRNITVYDIKKIPYLPEGGYVNEKGQIYDVYRKIEA